jgi:hypothetical protein
LDPRGIVYNIARMARRFEVISDPPFMRPKIIYKTHGETMVEAGHFFPGVTAEQIPGGEGFAAAEIVTLSTHNGNAPGCALALSSDHERRRSRHQHR